MNGSEVHVSELDWQAYFRDPLEDIQIAKFLAMYRLRCFLRFGNLDNFRTTLQHWSKEKNPICLNNRVKQLRQAMFFPTDELSAASKLSFFTNPRCKVFMWDSHVRRAIDNRYPLRGNPRPDGYTPSELPQFWENAARCLSDELANTDFLRALKAIEPLLIPVCNSVFNYSGDAIRDFAARRLLDKLMHYEGRLLEKKLLRRLGNDPCGAAAQETVQGWIERLREDFEAANKVNRRPEAAD